MKKSVPFLAAVLLLLPGVASSAPSVSIDTPREGEVVPVSESLDLEGTVTFEEPQPTTTRYYLRLQSCEISQNNPFGVPQGKGITLANPQTDTTAACINNGPIYRLTPANEVLKQQDAYGVTDGSGFTFDASRPATGQLTVSSYPVGPTWAGAGLTTIDIALQGQKIGENAEDFGTATVSYTANPMDGPKVLPFTITPNQTWNKKDMYGLGGGPPPRFHLRITIRGANAMHGFLVYNGASYITLPTWSASFDRRVEVSVDGSPFSTSGVVLGSGLSSWTATLPMPAPGPHTVQVRALQGRSVSEPVARTFTVAG